MDRRHAAARRHPDVTVVAPSQVRVVGQKLPTELVSRDLTGVYDLELIGSARLTVGGVAVASSLSTDHTGYSCAIEGGSPENILIEIDTNGPPTVSGASLSSDPVGPRFTLRLVAPAFATMTPRLNCRAEHGVAVGFAALQVGSVPSSGGPAIVVLQDTVEIDAIAAYSVRTTCPTPIMR